jgi:hypothetical protein
LGFFVGLADFVGFGFARLADAAHS